MKLETVEIENYRAIDHLVLAPDPMLTVLFGANGCGKTSVLSGIATGLGAIQTFFHKENGIDFLKTDRRASGAGPVRIRLTPVGKRPWLREETGREFAKITENKTKNRLELCRWLADICARHKKGEAVDLPIVAYYDTDRVVFGAPRRRRGFGDEFDRFGALNGALSARTDFRQFFQWFYAKENAELRALRRQRAGGHDSSDDTATRELRAVRQAISSMVGEASDPRIEENPLRFVVTMKDASGRIEELAIDQLSGGCRAVLTLAADLARRMAQGNPHLDAPLESEAVVLIDEVDLHLHPSWQQRILGDLRRTFPNTQFIVSTHSPQVLTTVAPEHIREIVPKGGGVTIQAPSAHTYGAEAGDVLEIVMGVDERPPSNRFVEILDRYTQFVDDGEGESTDAVTLRRKLEHLSPSDPALQEADLEMRRQKAIALIAGERS